MIADPIGQPHAAVLTFDEDDHVDGIFGVPHLAEAVGIVRIGRGGIDQPVEVAVVDRILEEK